MKECDILGVEIYSDPPPTYFQGFEDPKFQDLRPLTIAAADYFGDSSDRGIY